MTNLMAITTSWWRTLFRNSYWFHRLYSFLGKLLAFSTCQSTSSSNKRSRGCALSLLLLICCTQPFYLLI